MTPDSLSRIEIWADMHLRAAWNVMESQSVDGPKFVFHNQMGLMGHSNNLDLGQISPVFRETQTINENKR